MLYKTIKIKLLRNKKLILFLIFFQKYNDGKYI
jgi:hypothetical protein